MLRQKRSDIAQIVGGTSNLATTLLLELGAETLLQNLESILCVLGVQLGEVADTANASEEGLVADKGGLGSESCDHCNAFTTAKCLEGLVVDVSSLHNNGSTLDKS